MDDKNNTGSWNSGDLNSGDLNSGNRNSGDRNSGNSNSGDLNSGNLNSGDRNSGDRNSGYLNSGNRNSGYLNSNTPKVRMFNKDTDLDFDSDVLNKLRQLIWNMKTVCTWVEESNMSDKEKKENTTYSTTGGYLKGRDYKYCWTKFWEKSSQEDKDFFKSLPNFDADIFEEITGIKVNEEVKKKITLELTQDQIDKIQSIIKEK